MEADHTALKQKMDAAKARTRVLSNEIKANKQQIQKLLDKSKNDDEMIEALMVNPVTPKTSGTHLPMRCWWLIWSIEIFAKKAGKWLKP